MPFDIPSIDADGPTLLAKNCRCRRNCKEQLQGEDTKSVGFTLMVLESKEYGNTPSMVALKADALPKILNDNPLPFPRKDHKCPEFSNK